MRETFPPICVNCKRLKNNFTCEAFPGGIPNAILENQKDHRKPIEGDNGLQFVAIDKTFPFPENFRRGPSDNVAIS